MAFTVNTNDVQEQQGLIPPGDYEVVIKEVKEGESNSGTANIQIELVIRNDINHQYKNKHLWFTIWDTQKTRESGMYAKQINTVSKHAGLQNGATFNSFQEWGKFLFGRPVVATVKHEEYQGKTNERVSFISGTKYPQCQHNWNADNNQGSNQGPQNYNQGSNQQYNNQPQNNYNTGCQQASQGTSQNYNNGQQGYPNNQGYGNQNTGSPNQGNNGYYNNGQNVAGTGQACGAPPVNQNDDLPF